MLNQIDYQHPFLKKQIISYLGNKRKLIPFIDETINEIIRNDVRLANKQTETITFLDAFSGSGVVSRLSRLKGFKTISNDLELYANITAYAQSFNPDEADALASQALKNLTGKGGNYHQLLDYLNQIDMTKKDESLFFSKHFAPSSLDCNPDKERMFFTPENALWLDSLIEIIFSKEFSEDARCLVLGSLFFTAIRKSNTSGSFTGYLKLWSKNAMEPMKLEPLPLVYGQKFCVSNSPAEKLFSDYDVPEVDIVYADPPYDIKQYGGYYSIFNRIALNNKQDPGPVQKNKSGRLIRDTVSDFNKIKTIADTFSEFVSSLKCKYLVLSYSNEGVLGCDRLRKILEQNGKNKVIVKTKDHKRYTVYNTKKDVKTFVEEKLFIVKMNCK